MVGLGTRGLTRHAWVGKEEGEAYLQAGLCRVRLLRLARIACLAAGLAASLSCTLKALVSKGELFRRTRDAMTLFPYPFHPACLLYDPFACLFELFDEMRPILRVSWRVTRLLSWFGKSWVVE